MRENCTGGGEVHCFLTAGPLVSVVVPVYNVEKYLERCVDSLLTQTYRNLEIILVNDGSTDNSLPLMEAYAKQDDRIRIVQHEKNRGLFQARISGSEAAKGTYIAFVDSDDYVSIDWFRTLLKKAEYTEADIVVGDWCFDYDGKHKDYINLDPFRLNDYCLEGNDILDNFLGQEGTCFSWTVVWNKLYRKSLWDQCLPLFKAFSQKHGHMLMWEDIAFSSALWSHAKKVTNVHQVLYYYFKHDDAATAVATKKNRAKNLKYISDSSAAMAFLREVVVKRRQDETTTAHIRSWNSNAASMLYHDLVVDSCDRSYEPLIREAFSFDGPFGKRKEFFYSLSTGLSPAFSWQESIKKEIIAPATHFVSFDIFDTLIQRPFSEPADLFAVLSDEFNRDTSSYVDFAELRISAEHSCREKTAIFCPSAEDITLDQIYEELAETTRISREKLTRLKQREQELELQFCTARKAGKVLFDLAKDTGKHIIICSDMYLPQDTVTAILSKAGYSGYEKLYLSSQLLLTKATGHLYKYAQRDLGCRDGASFLHIGDNWASDVERAKSCGWKTGHMSRAVDLLKNHNPGIYSGESYHRIWGRTGQHADYAETMNSFLALRNAVGLAANRIFDDPFVSFHPQSDFNADPNYIGYLGLGMHLLAVCEWLLKLAKERNIPTIHFVARDGYMVKTAFDMLNRDAVKSSYIRLSRKALILADVKTPEDLYSLFRKVSVLHITPKKLTEYLHPIIPMETEQIRQILAENHIFYDRDFSSIAEYKKCVKVLIENILDFSLLPAYQEKLRVYFSDIIKPGDYIFDIGYSGRPEAALSSILGFPVGSLYIHVNSDMAGKRQLQYHCPNECFYENKPCITGVMREHMLMEPGPSTIGYEMVGGRLAPKFEPYGEEYFSAFMTRQLQSAALDFIRDYCSVFGEYRESMVLPLEALSAPFEYYLHDAKSFDRRIFATLPFEDALGEGATFGALDFWERELSTHNLTGDQHGAAYLPPDLSDLYMDGLFVKFYRMINKRFPKGSRARALVKRIARMFVR